MGRCHEPEAIVCLLDEARQGDAHGHLWTLRNEVDLRDCTVIADNGILRAEKRPFENILCHLFRRCQWIAPGDLLSAIGLLLSLLGLTETCIMIDAGKSYLSEWYLFPAILTIDILLHGL